MARTRATIYSSILADNDFTSLTSSAQRLYLLLLVQSRLSLAGHLDYVPARWARLAPDTTPDQIRDAVATLEAARFVAVDRDTEELTIRSFIAYDVGAGKLSAQVVKGLWSAWCGIASARLRAEIVRGVPETMWPRLSSHAPPEASQIRRSAPIEWEVRSPIDSQTIPQSNGDGRSQSIVPSSVFRLPSSAANNTRATIEADFEQWWKNYPRKRDRGHALKAYRTARRRGGVDAKLLTEALERTATEWERARTPPDKIPYAATWLNGERWNDQLDEHAPDTDRVSPGVQRTLDRMAALKAAK